MNVAVSQNTNTTVEINISNSGAIDLQIETPRLVLSPVVQADAQEYHEFLYGDPTVVEKFGTGDTRPLEKVEERLADWSARWENGNPFSALTIRMKDGSFVGQIVAGGGSEPGYSEMAYLIRQSLWDKRFGTEATSAVVNQLAPLLKAYGYKVEEGSLTKLEATVRPDNPASGKILKTVGLEIVDTSEKFGALREHYEADIKLPSPEASWEILSFGQGLHIKE